MLTFWDQFQPLDISIGNNPSASRYIFGKYIQATLSFATLFGMAFVIGWGLRIGWG